MLVEMWMWLRTWKTLIGTNASSEYYLAHDSQAKVIVDDA
ncbi:hypothetical protein SynPROSU1_00836 [Synechococcus sp. PROS-U-1]|nr:hypothetical protein SynPROSU1_00836 [Synechococcus sp. PROS-U-1]